MPDNALPKLDIVEMTAPWCAYAVTPPFEPVSIAKAIKAAVELGFSAILADLASDRSPDGVSDDRTVAKLEALALKTHEQGLLLLTTLVLDRVWSSHVATSSGAFSPPPVASSPILDPRWPILREPGVVNLRQPKDVLLQTWWARRLKSLRLLGVDGFVVKDCSPAGRQLASSLLTTGEPLVLATGDATFAAQPNGILALSGGSEKQVFHDLASAALNRSAWVLATEPTQETELAIKTINSLIRRGPWKGRRRTWVSTTAALEIRFCSIDSEAVLSVYNKTNRTEPWSHSHRHAVPWLVAFPVSGFNYSDGAIQPGQTIVFSRSKPANIDAAPTLSMTAAADRSARVIISRFSPSVENGAFSVKSIAGERITITADIFSDGHERLAAHVLFRAADQSAWASEPLLAGPNDTWTTSIVLDRCGLHEMCIEAWIDVWGGLTRDLERKFLDNQYIDIELQEAGEFVTKSMNGTVPATSALLSAIAAVKLDDRRLSVATLLSPSVHEEMAKVSAKPFLTKSFVQPIQVEREAARFSSWYEVFPRSLSTEPNTHGTFEDVIARLTHIAAMGFDTLYFTPIHPIGRRNRKGRNNATTSLSDDVGSPYAIGSAEGGHDAVHPQLGSLQDFRKLVAAATDVGLEIALDFAIQCAPDHPWLSEHPGWFAWRPDGSIKYAENPPKKYQDIVNVDFYATDSLPSLWLALRDVVLFWIDCDVLTFRVDNPHTKPLPFWQWLISSVKAQHPDVIFLSEAFTTPKRMYHLAKCGFSQSYTYFTWRNDKASLTAYLTELTQTEVVNFFRPHFFVNTPDINPYFLQTSGRPGFLIRAALAATLSGLWGAYAGFEHCESKALPGREEYLDSEKYQLRQRPERTRDDIVDEIAKLNEIRRQEPALQTHLGLTFHSALNDSVIYYSKRLAEHDHLILVAVNLDPHNTQEAVFEVPLWLFGLPDDAAVTAVDLLTNTTAQWIGKLQQMTLSPTQPYAIWRIYSAVGSQS